MVVIEHDNGWLFFIQECQGCWEDWPASMIAFTPGEPSLHCAFCAPDTLPEARFRKVDELAALGSYWPVCRACNRAGLRESEMGFIHGRAYCPGCWPETIWEFRESMRMVRELDKQADGREKWSLIS